MFEFFSPHQGTPLHWAARGGHVDTVTFFLEQGIDINIKNDSRVSEQDYTADSKFVQPISAHVEKCGKVEQALLRSHTVLIESNSSRLVALFPGYCL